MQYFSLFIMTCWILSQVPGAFRSQIAATLDITEVGMLVYDKKKQWTLHEADTSETVGPSCKKKRTASGSNIMPIIEDALSSKMEWFEITDTPQYQYPGVVSKEVTKFLGHISDCSQLPHYTTANKHFLYTETQLSKGHYNDNERDVLVNGKGTRLRIRYATCKGVLKCPEKGCTFAASRNAKKCSTHPAAHLAPSGPCPVYVVYVLYKKQLKLPWKAIRLLPLVKSI